MKKNIFIAMIFSIVLGSPFYGEKADFRTAEKFAPENLRKLVGTRSVNPAWVEESDIFIYEFKKNNITEYYYINAREKIKRTLLNRKLLSKKIFKITGEKSDPDSLELKETRLDKNLRDFSFIYKKNKFRYNLKNKKLTNLGSVLKIREKMGFGKRSPDGKWIIYSKGHNIYLKNVSKKNSIEKQLTNDGEKWFSYSVNEKGENCTKKESTIGVWFSDSQNIYCLRKDKRKLKDLFLIHSLSDPRPTLELYKYAMAGDKELPRFHISIIDIKSGEIRGIETEKWKNQQIGSEGVSGIYPGDDPSTIYFVRTSRDWKDVELCEADTSTGKVKILIKERSEPYWNADFQQFHETGENGRFIWWSEKSGRGHIYLHDRNGYELKQLTSGDFTVSNIISIDKEKKFIFFAAYGKRENEDPYYRKYYRIDFNGNGFTELTPEIGTHTVHMSSSLEYYTDTYSTVKNPDISVLKDIDGNIIFKMEELDTTELRSSGWLPPVKFKVKAADNETDLYGVMWKPFNMTKGKKYPVISYVYPGPQGEPVPKTFFQVRDNRVSNIPLAQLGFIVITVGQRGGSPLRSRKYHNYGYGNARDYPLADNKYAIEQLAEIFDYIDVSRVGIYGRSGGGFMAAAAILVYPDFYKAAVSSCGNHDNNIYDYNWGEIHYGIEKNIATNIEVAGNLKGRLLLIHGEIDNNVHPANTFRLANELIKKGKRFDMMIFPGKRHAYDEYTSYLERMMWYYFAEHLMGDRRDNIDMFGIK